MFVKAPTSLKFANISESLSSRAYEFAAE